MPKTMKASNKMAFRGFNVDFLVHTNVLHTQFVALFQTHGQITVDITRPNKRGGTCIDWIVIDSVCDEIGSCRRLYL